MLGIIGLPLVVIPALIVLLVTMSAYRMMSPHGSSTAGKTNTVCETEACKRTAQRLLEYMDPTVKPCDDFYRFACGKFLKTAEIRNAKTENSSYVQVDELLEDQLMAIVSEPSSPDEARPYRQMKQLFNLCMDEEKIDARGIGHALALLQEAGGWPVLGGWSDEGWTIFDTEKRLMKLYIGGNSFYSIGVDQDFKKSNRYVFTLDQASLGLAREYLVKGEDDHIVNEYYKYMVDIAVMFGADRQTATDQMKEVLLFEIELAKMTKPQEDRRDHERMYNPYGLQDLMAEIGWLNWKELIENIMPESVPLMENELIIVNEVEFIKSVENFLKKYENRVLANYMFWLAATGMCNWLTTEMRNRSFEFGKAVLGIKERKPRWKECIGVASSLGLAISSKYVEKFFDKNTKKEALELNERIREELLELFKEVSWLDETTRKRADYKASNMVNHVAYPSELEDVSKIVKYYEKLTLNEEHYFEARLDYDKWITDYGLSILREEINKTDWRTHGYVTEVNAFYDPLENSMIFPAGILQRPFFDVHVPKYINYAIMGCTMGHEITHGFDDQGCQFDCDGNLVDWWEESTKKKFNKKTQCVVDQYNGFKDVYTGLKLNGINTQGENVADSGGLKLAYRAYQRLVRKLPEPEPLLPGLQQYNQDQLFFLSMANVECTRYRPEALKDLITTDVHSPSEFRINGVLKNFKEFSKTFSCGWWAPMNPWKKCCVW